MRYIFLLAFMSFNAHAGMLNPECTPSGIINKIKEYINPEEFWSGAIIEIDANLKFEIEQFKYNQLVDRNDKIRHRLNDSEYRAAGLTEDSQSQRKLERELASLDNELHQFDVNMLKELKNWSIKCKKYAGEKRATALIGW
jgi:hypothetical protein